MAIQKTHPIKQTITNKIFYLIHIYRHLNKNSKICLELEIQCFST